MTIVCCRECAEQVSSEARACPHCEIPYPAVDLESDKNAICPSCSQLVTFDDGRRKARCPNCRKVLSRFRNSAGSDETGSSGGAPSNLAGLAALSSWPIQLGALGVALLIASTSEPLTYSSPERLGRGAGVVIFATVIATMVLVWKRHSRGLIPLLALLFVIPVSTWTSDRSESVTDWRRFAADVSACYREAIGSFAGRAQLFEIGSAAAEQQRTGGFVNECLLVRGWSEAERSILAR